MGLDMRLERHIYVKNPPHLKPVNITIKSERPGYENINISKISYLVEEIAYWRKAYAIHRWFIDNCSDGLLGDDVRLYVGRDDLQVLLDQANEVIDSLQRSGLLDTQAAENFFPLGSFFAENGYDNYFLEELIYTRNAVQDALTGDVGISDFIYQAG